MILFSMRGKPHRGLAKANGRILVATRTSCKPNILSSKLGNFFRPDNNREISVNTLAPAWMTCFEWIGKGNSQVARKLAQTP